MDNREVTLFFVGYDEMHARQQHPFDSYEGAWRMARSDARYHIYYAKATIQMDTFKVWEKHGKETTRPV